MQMIVLERCRGNITRCRLFPYHRAGLLGNPFEVPGTREKTICHVVADPGQMLNIGIFVLSGNDDFTDTEEAGVKGNCTWPQQRNGRRYNNQVQCWNSSAI